MISLNIGLVKKSVQFFFCKIKDTFFIFTNHSIDLDILKISALSHYWLLVDRARGAVKHLPVHQTAHSKELVGHNDNSAKKLCKPLLTCSIGHSTFSIHCTNLFLCVFGCVFTFLKITTHNTPKMMLIFFHLQY